jgi:exopolysaccharide biosynthesis protein
MLALGAAEALNLDGGGSTTLVARGAGGALAVANRPSDAAGERPVANALAVRACALR